MMWSGYEGNGGISGQVLVTIESPDTAHIHATPELRAFLLELRAQHASGSEGMHDFDATCAKHGLGAPCKWEGGR